MRHGRFERFRAGRGGYRGGDHRRQADERAALAAGSRAATGDSPAPSAGQLPTLKMPTARGWEAGRMPVPAPGLKVNAFAPGLKHPRWIDVLPNGDVLAAEALSAAGRR